MGNGFPRMDLETGSVIIRGRIYPHRYNTHGDRALGHHGIVWRKGRAARKALVESETPDLEVQRALQGLGLEPGNNLSMETWEARHDPENPAPDRRVEGPLLEVTLEWNGPAREGSTPTHREIAWHEAFVDAGPEDFDIRFGGHEHLVPHWRSGCVTCLFSCPGGRTSNAAYVIRDQARKRREFRAEEAVLPPDGTEVIVRFHIRP